MDEFEIAPMEAGEIVIIRTTKIPSTLSAHTSEFVLMVREQRALANYFKEHCPGWFV